MYTLEKCVQWYSCIYVYIYIHTYYICIVSNKQCGMCMHTLLAPSPPSHYSYISSSSVPCLSPDQLPSLSTLTPRAATCLPRLSLSPSTVSWWDSAKKWLLSQPAELASLLEPLLQRLLPLCLGFLAPLLRSEDSSHQAMSDVQSATFGSSTSLVSGQTQLQPQELRLVATHLVTTCCNVLEVSLSVCVLVCSLHLSIYLYPLCA